jgi:ATP-dependent Clp protease ATP-binding subunit ClpA
MTTFQGDEVLGRTFLRAFVEASRRGDTYVGCEHLLLALADSDPLSEIGVTLERLRASVDRLVGTGMTKVPAPPMIGTGPHSNWALERAKSIASERGAAHLTPSDILRGLLDEEGPSQVAAAVLEDASVDVAALRRTVG